MTGYGNEGEVKTPFYVPPLSLSLSLSLSLVYSDN